MPIKYQPPSIQRGREAEHETQKAAVNDVNEMNGSTRTHRKKEKQGRSRSLLMAETEGSVIVRYQNTSSISLLVLFW